MSNRTNEAKQFLTTIEFLRQSNNIEDVHDDLSLQQAIFAWKHLLTRKKSLNITLILKAHEILMQYQPLHPNDIGLFRRSPVWVAGRPGAPYEQILLKMKQWIMNVNDVRINGKKESEIFLNKITKEHHIQFEKIHPFIDGNGRIGRILYNWERLKVGLPIHVIHTGDEQQEYYDWFK